MTIGTEAAAALPEIECRMRLPQRVRVGAAVPLTFELVNRGGASVRLLPWNTPLEGWTGRSLRVTHDERDISYRGPQVKRAAPSARDYRVLFAGGRTRGVVDLSKAYDMSAPGRYRVEFAGALQDVTTGLPMPDSPSPLALECAPVEVEVVTRG